MKILLHSSKTMKPESTRAHELTTPNFMKQATYLNEALRNMSVAKLSQLMHINETLAEKVRADTAAWHSDTTGSAAALTFRGDIYSGLAAGQWSKSDAKFAQEHLLILSGVYGLLRPFDAIKPYRLEMGYKLKTDNTTTLEKYWEGELAKAFDPRDTYVNLTANEYFKVIKKQLASSRVISPKFLTVSPKTGQPVFVTVHAKIARGAFANWLITNKITNPAQIPAFKELNYAYDEQLSTETEPVFVCQEFGGIGMSVRLA